MSIQVGDSLPSAALNEGNPKTTVDPATAFSSGKVVIFGVPGAFTPGCDKTHLPGYVADREKFAAKGVTEIVCVAVNDAFVMSAWGTSHGAEGKVRMLADPNATFTKAIGMEVEVPPLGGTRSKRFALVVENGKVTHVEVEPDGFGLTCSLSGPLLERV